MKRGYLALMSAALFLSASTTVLALDANDIGQMIQNRVDDAVIINMISSQKLSRPLTAEEVVRLSAIGASPAVLERLTRADASYSTASAPVTTYVEPAPTTTYVQSAPTTTYVQQQPNVVVTSPPTYYYNSCPPTVVTAPRYYYNPRPSVFFDFSFGNSRRHWGPPPPRFRGGPPPGFRGGPPPRRRR